MDTFDIYNSGDFETFTDASAECEEAIFIAFDSMKGAMASKYEVEESVVDAVYLQALVKSACQLAARALGDMPDIERDNLVAHISYMIRGAALCVVERRHSDHSDSH